MLGSDLQSDNSIESTS